MKYSLLIVALLAATSASAQAPVITQTAPVVNQGATLQFTETLSEAGTWSCAGTDSTGAGTACLGSIVAGTGVYTAPAAVVAQHSYGGFQLLPNNSVFNTRVDSLPLRGDSATLMTGAGTVSLTYENDFTANYADGSTPLQSMLFNYTSGNNGNFQIPAYPNINLESGWFARWNGNEDHHLLVIDKTNGTMQEMYQYRSSLATTAASVTGNVATLTFASSPLAAGFFVGEVVGIGGFTGADTYFNNTSTGVTLTTVNSTQAKFALVHADAAASTNGKMGMEPTVPLTTSASGIRYLNSTYNLPNTQAGGVDAAGLYVMPLVLGLQEFKNACDTGGTIKHALRMTLQNGFLHNAFLWPGTASANAGGGANFYGERVRLKSSFNQSSFSACAQILLTQLKQYGLIIADGGTGWAMNPEGTKWPPEYQAFLAEVQSAAIQGSTNFEVVDESGLQVAANQTCPTPSACSLSTANRETVTFTRTSDSATASVDVVLQGVTVGLPSNQLYFQAGAPAQQLTAFVNGSATKTTTWTMDSPVGTLTSGGLYTPPATDGSYTMESQANDGGSPNISRMLEDKNVTSTGSINATARTAGLGQWIMYTLALKSASLPNSVVQAVHTGGSGVCSNTCTDGFNAPVTTGNLGIVIVYDKSDATATISSTSFACGTLMLDSNSPKRGATTSLWIYTVQITSNTCGGGSVGITFNHSVTAELLATEYRNLASSNVVDCSATGTGTTYILSSASCATANANDLVIGFGIVLGSANPKLTSGGNYTTVTATSVADPTISAKMSLTVLPAGTIRIISADNLANCGPQAFPCTPYTDTNTNKWIAQTGDDGGSSYWHGGSWPGTPDIFLYQIPWSSGADIRYDIYVPNGAYQVTAKFGSWDVSGATSMNLEAQGVVAYTNQDITVAAGGQNLPVDFIVPATVTDNKLSFVLRNTGLGTANTPFISALQIIRTGVGVATTLTPNTKVTSGVSLK